MQEHSIIEKGLKAREQAKFLTRINDAHLIEKQLNTGLGYYLNAS